MARVNGGAETEMQVVILAGGLATRLGGLTRNQPKSMIRIQGKPFLAYQLELLKKAGMEEIVVCIGHLGEQIETYFGGGERHGVRLRYSVEKTLLGTAGALKNAGYLLDGPFLVMYGDSYLPIDFGSVTRYFQSQEKLALMTVFRNYDRFDRSNTAIEGNLVTEYDKKAKTQRMVYIDYGASVFRKKVLEMIPEDRHYSLEELFRQLITTKDLLAYQVQERFYEIGSAQGLRQFEDYISEEHDSLKSSD